MEWKKHVVRQERSHSGQHDACNVDIFFSPGGLASGQQLCAVCHIRCLINTQPFTIVSRLSVFSIFIRLSRSKLAVHIQVEV